MPGLMFFFDQLSEKRVNFYHIYRVPVYGKGQLHACNLALVNRRVQINVQYSYFELLYSTAQSDYPRTWTPKDTPG